MAKPHLLFVTGKLAEPALRRTLGDIAGPAGFDYSVAVLPITVVALATTAWIARHLAIPPEVNRVLLPGLCKADLDAFTGITTMQVERGPKDLRELPDFFQAGDRQREDYGAHDITILAEINHAPQLELPDLLRQARAARDSGAN